MKSFLDLLFSLVVLILAILASQKFLFNSSYDETQYFSYKEYGNHERPTIVIIPGLDGITAFFNDIIPELTVEYHVVVYYLPLSPKLSNSKEYTFEYLALTLRDLLEDLQLSQVSIIGESFGGVVTQYFAYLYPAYVEHIILLSSMARLDLPPDVAWKAKYLLPPLEYFGSLNPSLAQAIFARIHVHDVVEPHESNYVRQLFIKEASSAHFYSILRRLQIIQNLNILHQTKLIKNPTLIVYGEDDHFTSQSSLELHTILPKSEIVSLPGGHLPHVTSPKIFARLCLEFIQRHKSLNVKVDQPSPQPTVSH